MAEAPIRKRIDGALSAVPSLDEDRILRQFLSLVGATVRTNFYQAGADGRPPETITFKFDGKAVDPAPQPRPTARSWSTRRASRACTCASGRSRAAASAGRTGAQDFRTEVLGPGEGAAGQERGDRADRRQGRLPAQAAAAHGRPRRGAGRGHRRLHASSSPRLLDITDNVKDGTVVPPPRVVRHDGDDPYLVVAADKGTATFSDIANEISADARLLAGRRLRLGRLGRLRPQEDGHHRARRLGVREAPLPRDGHRHPEPALHGGRRRRHVGRRVRQRHAAVARRSGWWPPSTTATSSSIPIRMPPRASPSASACSTCRARPGRTTTRPRSPRAAACSRAPAKSIPLSAEVQAAAGRRRRRADAGRADPRHPEVRDRPALVRRHRHLRARLQRDRRRGRRPRQRRAARQRRRAARQGGRRGRQPRPDAARPHRVRRARRPAQHRLHRQLGRRQHLRPRGQHQDRAGAGGALGPPDA